MDDTSFIIGLMKTETDALGFIPSTAIQSRWIPKGHYIIQKDSRGKRRGYLLYGPPKAGRDLHVNQVCIEYDQRLRGFAFLAVRELINIAHDADCAAITLRCASTLPANWFWMAIGFQLIGITAGGLRRGRTISTYRLDLRKVGSIHHPPHKFRLTRVSRVG